MKTIALRLATAFAVSLSAIACSASDKQVTDNPRIVALDSAGSQLRADFNRAKGKVRLLFVVDPACSVCLRGMADINDAFLSETRDPRLETFVVHTSVIGGEQKNVAPAAELIENPNAHHYWDSTGNFGRDVSRSLQLKNGDEQVYAWDVWMIYDGTAELPAQGVPSPALFMHQLPKLKGQPGRPMLDARAFGAKARALLTRLPST